MATTATKGKAKKKVQPGSRARAAAATEKPQMCEKAERLKQMRDMMKALEKGAKVLRDELIAEFGVGAHTGFSVAKMERWGLSTELLERKLGDLSRYKVLTEYLQIDFH